MLWENAQHLLRDIEDTLYWIEEQEDAKAQALVRKWEAGAADAALS